MSTFASDDQESENLQYASIPSQEDLNKELNAPAQEKPQSPQSNTIESKAERPDWLPPKFDDPETLVQSYGELESELGRQRTEIGELRRLTTELVGNRQTPTQHDESDQHQVPNLSADDVLNDPGKAIGQVVQAEVQKALAPVTQSVSNLAHDMTMGEFQRKHPSFQQDQNDPAFAAWLQEDPLRNSFAANALQGANAGDLADIDALFTQWESYRDSAALQQDEQTPEERAAEESAAAIAPSGGMGADVPKEYVRRSDLDAIMMNDRERYDTPAFQKWMQGKYEQGLVK